MHDHPGNWFNVFEPLIPHWAHHYIDIMTIASWLVILFLVFTAVAATRRMTRVPHGWQNFWEWLNDVFRGFARGVIGPGGERYMPLLAVLFMYIFCLNVLGMIPGFISPTASLNMTISLAVVVFFAVQYFGIKTHGMAYFKHFIGDPPWLFPINLPLHIIGELAKPLSLSVRLFGNIFGEDKAVEAFLDLSTKVFISTYIPIPLHLPMVAFALFGGFIQAFVFTTLSAAYIGMAVSGHADDHHQHEEIAAESEQQVQSG